MEREVWMTMDDDVEIYVKKWYKEHTKPTAIVQLSHGMAEHINRYDHFANFLLDQNIFVYGNDHRGHGKTGDRQGLLGYFSDTDGFSKTTNDLISITKRIKQDYEDVPLFLLGHSMGSFLAREYIQTESLKLNGVILMGTGYHTVTASSLARTIAEALPPKEKSELMNNLAFSKYNQKITNPKTSFDWLTRDEKVVYHYMEDPYCGYVPTALFFHDLMDGLVHIHLKNKNKAIRKDLPMLIISGEADPVGHYGKGVFKVAKHYHKVGLNNIQTMLFEGARHELLNEVNKDEIYHMVYNWIKSCLSY